MMPSSFPGMDPYLEAPASWQEFYSRFINTMSDFLVPKVRPKYSVYIERHVYVAEVCGEGSRLCPDVTIVETGRQSFSPKPQAETSPIAEVYPWIIRQPTADNSDPAEVW